MRHRVHTFKIGRSGAHRRALLANMAGSLLINGEIRTTITKAKEARRFVDKLITLGKKGDLHHRRLAAARLRDKEAVKTLFDKVAAKYATRVGGYTRIIRLGNRVGDGAEICLLQLVEEVGAARPEKKARQVKAAKPSGEKTGKKAPESPPAAAPPPAGRKEEAGTELQPGKTEIPEKEAHTSGPEAKAEKGK